ncbi:MAG: SBBP repeat-containing protein [Candidatus Acidiferrales bacterium]
MRASSRLFSACAFFLCTMAAAFGQGQSRGQAAVQPAWSGSSSAPSTKAAIAAEYGKLPLMFEANHGQASDQVRYLSHSAGQLLLLEKDGAVLSLTAGHLAAGRSGPAGAKQNVSAHDDLKIRFVGASPSTETVPLDEQPGKSNYLLGNDPAKWRTNVENYSRVRYNALYPGVDLIFYGNPSRLEHDFIVEPGADYRRIALELSGSRKIRLAPDGSVTVTLANGVVQFSAPKIYQMRDGKKVEVKGGYTLTKDLLAFNVGAHDATLPLVIDPVLSYSTYLAGNSSDISYGIALDAAGNAYVTGLTSSTNFPSLNPYQSACDGCANNGPDVFITKLNPTGTAPVYSTYLGGSGYDAASGIAVDASGNAIVGGGTNSTDFPLHNPIQTTPSGGFQGFVTSLSKDGTSLNFSTYLGGTDGGGVSSVATDSDANVYAEGQLDSAGFPVKPATNVIGAPPAPPSNDIFVAKFTVAGALVFGTVIGPDPKLPPGASGSGLIAEVGSGLAVDANQDVYISGAAGPGLLVTPGAFQTTYTGPPITRCYDCMGFVAELKPDGSAFVFASYLGGSAGDQVTGLALDANRNIYMTGNTNSSDFPVTPGAFQTTFPEGATPSPCCATFVTKMNPEGSALVYSSFLGGPNSYASTYSSGIAVDAAGEAVVTGYTTSLTFPLWNPLQAPVPGKDGSAVPATYVTKFNVGGTAILFSTLFSGSTGTSPAAIAVNAATPNDIYITGTTNDKNLPTTPGAFQTSIPPNSGTQHGFVTKFDLGALAAAACASQPSMSFVSNINVSSAPEPLVLTSCGTSPLTISDVSVTGPFTQTNNCQTAVPPGMTCTVNVVFRTSTPGTRDGTLKISDNAPIQPLLISLTSLAEAPVVQFSDDPYPVPDTLVGQSGPAEQLLVFNQGNSVLSISTVTEEGPDFSAVKQNCLSVQPGTSCVINVIFHPTAAGLRTGTLTVNDNAADTPQTVTLEGNGLTAYPVPTLSLITPGALRQGSAAQSITVQGGNMLPVSKIVVQGTMLAVSPTSGGYSATIPASLLANLAELTVQTYNPPPGGGYSNALPLSVYQQLAIGGSSLIYEPYTRKLYASIASNAVTRPNSVMSIDPETEILGAPISVGASPNHLGVAGDGTFLYVGLDGANAIQQIKLPSGALGTSVSLAGVSPGYFLSVYDIAVEPGTEQSYVASFSRLQGTPSEAGTGLVLNGKLTSTLPGYNTGPAVDSVCFLADPTAFYGTEFTGSEVFKISVLSSYPWLHGQVDSPLPAGSSSNFVCDSRYIYDFTGHVFDPVAKKLVGTYPFETTAESVAVDESVGRTFAFAGEAGVSAFDQTTFAQVGVAPIPANFGTITSLLRWGTDGLAYLTYSYRTDNYDLVLLRSSFTHPPVARSLTPTLESSSPQVSAGNGNYQLTVTGTNFVPGAEVEWNGELRTTIFKSSIELIADIPASDVARSGTAEITVMNPPFLGPTSNKHSYVILPAK